MSNYRGHLAGASVFYAGYLAVLVLVYTVDSAYTQFTLVELIAYPVCSSGCA